MDEKPKDINSGDGRGQDRPDIDLEKPHDHHMIPVWFFVGVILLIYGVIILGTGIYEFNSPPPTVLAYTHPAIWWGALLTVIGGFYVYTFKPKKS
jgi:FtsH-binding integral membrane protein